MRACYGKEIDMKTKALKSNMASIQVCQQKGKTAHGKPAKKTHYPHTGVRWPFCPQRVSPAVRGSVFKGNMASAADNSWGDRGRNFCLPPVEKEPLGVKGAVFMKRKSRGRPRNPDSIRVVPVFREKPDIAKLGRAVIAMAEELAKEKKGQEENNENQD